MVRGVKAVLAHDVCPVLPGIMRLGANGGLCFLLGKECVGLVLSAHRCRAIKDSVACDHVDRSIGIARKLHLAAVLLAVHRDLAVYRVGLMGKSNSSVREHVNSP